jgi:F1F0 ATPase subunit 2
MMSFEPTGIAVAFFLGLALGAGYLAALWGSVRAVARSGRSPAWLLGGSVLRIGILLALFYLVMNGHLERLLACLGGFIIMRFAVTRWVTAALGKDQPASAREA